MTDNELIVSILDGDMQALKELIRRHDRMLHRTARSILRDDAEAEDAVQDAFVQAYRALDSFRGEARVSTWLVRIVANEALMRRRRNVRQALALPSGGPGQDTEVNFVSSTPGPENETARLQMMQNLEERIDALPEEFRGVFRLRALGELSVGETAAALGIPPATVRTRYFRARKLLRDSMAPELKQHSDLPSLLISDQDLERLTLLKPHAALLREMGRAVVISAKAAKLVDAVMMNTQVDYTDETTGAKRHVNIVYPHEAGGCACSVSILAPVGTALIGLSVGQSIEWDFPSGNHRRLRVDKVIHQDCPLRSPMDSAWSARR